ncbi:hypothetical protein M404DRAFT_996537 [Pisolithus tinctorius Marx 270]|uniref:Uncharacterized protein n=1 Tax=Pisolithus tinctorius Marx 270 TaxID=870435 RepID=A0A0C3PMW3_PISTI|nr:hypothetical protein M404DRAFT_996537 [Pisolithus tinctorius Marx 270]
MGCTLGERPRDGQVDNSPLFSKCITRKKGDISSILRCDVQSYPPIRTLTPLQC